MSLTAAFGYSLVASFLIGIVWLVLRFLFPREASYDPQAEPYGDVPHQEGK